MASERVGLQNRLDVKKGLMSRERRVQGVVRGGSRDR